MAYTESDRLAFNDDLRNKDYAEVELKAVADWLAANPQVGELNGGKYYIIENGEQVDITPLHSFK